jgi:uncharacterized SAM-binding protein YcdF (DUF218 family)
MEAAALKPLLTALVMPPLGLLLLALLGLLLAIRRKTAGHTLLGLTLLAFWLLSCHGAAVWLARTLLPQFAPTSLAQLKTARVQAIVVLGGGVLPESPEYGQAQLAAPSASRLRYGVWLARQSGLPLAFSGGLGWAASSLNPSTEAEVAARVALQDYGVKLRWLEAQSRDTAENARLMAPMLARDGIARIALVTDARHMPRALAAFKRTGLAVTPAPANYVLPEQSALMEWLPSAQGLLASQQVLREWLGYTLASRLSA